MKKTLNGVDRLTYIVNDLDLITKFESGIAKLDISQFNILSTINEVIEMLEVQTDKNNIKLFFKK